MSYIELIVLGAIALGIIVTVVFDITKEFHDH